VVQRLSHSGAQRFQPPQWSGDAGIDVAVAWTSRGRAREWLPQNRSIRIRATMSRGDEGTVSRTADERSWPLLRPMQWSCGTRSPGAECPQCRGHERGANRIQFSRSLSYLITARLPIGPSFIRHRIGVRAYSTDGCRTTDLRSPEGLAERSTESAASGRLTGPPCRREVQQAVLDFVSTTYGYGKYSWSRLRKCQNGSVGSARSGKSSGGWGLRSRAPGRDCRCFCPRPPSWHPRKWNGGGGRLVITHMRPI